MGQPFGVFGDPQFWAGVRDNARELPSRLGAYGKAIAAVPGQFINDSDRAVEWSAGALPGRFAEGTQDAARHTDWMASTADRLESMARYGLVALPQGAANSLARGLGTVGAVGMGAGIEAIGLGKTAFKAGGQAMDGKFSRAGSTLAEGWNSTKMDLNNNLAGAAMYSQIKDPIARRAAILEAVTSAQRQNAPGLGFDVPLSGELVRRR